ncbi:MAG TPA: VWA domain-containing protein [Thermoanaerobaculia bacterium]|nr:VWA domain-containing protein [Thermoanaerobaculia bacterium]
MWRLTAIAAFLLLSAAASPQQVELPAITETLDVTIVNLDVVVTDRNGNRVHGLTAEDFEVFENGLKQPVTNFSEVVPAAVPSAAVELDDPPRAIVIFIDNLSLDFFNRKRVLTQLTGFLRKAVRPVDEAMIFTWNRRLTIEVPPTADVALLEEGVQRAMKEVSAAAMRQQQMRTFFQPDLSTSSSRIRALDRRRFAQEVAHDVEQTAKAITSVLSRMSGVDGRKIMILVTEGLQLEPGSEVLGTAEGAAEEAEASAAARDYASHDLIDSITRTANASGVTIYSVHGAGTGSAVDVEDPDLLAAMARNTSAASSIAALSVISDRTGGLVTARTGAFARGFDQIAADLSGYYSIGYRATIARKDGERKLEVHTRDRDLVARARRSFVDRSMESEIEDRVVANLLFAPQRGSMPIRARIGGIDGSRRAQVSVTVELQVPITALTFLPAGESYAAGFSVFIAAADSRDTMSEVSELSQRLSFAAADLPRTPGAYYTYSFDVQTNRGNRISIAVVDELSKVMGFARLQVPARSGTPGRPRAR